MLGEIIQCHNCKEEFQLQHPLGDPASAQSSENSENSKAISLKSLKEKGQAQAPQFKKADDTPVTKIQKVNTSKGKETDFRNTLSRPSVRKTSPKSTNLVPIITMLSLLIAAAAIIFLPSSPKQDETADGSEKEKFKSLADVEAELKADAEKRRQLATLENRGSKSAKEKKDKEKKSQADSKKSQVGSNSESFEKNIVSILDYHCTDCHNEVEQEGDLNFELFFEEQYAELEPDMWEKVAKVVSLGRMPPKKSDEMPDEEKEALYSWVESLSEKWANGEMGKDPGKTTIQRLNKYEYNYTIRDLFGISSWLVGDFPEDGASRSGFTNNADALYLPTLLVENYFETAEKVLDLVYSDRSIKSRYLFTNPAAEKSEEEAAKKILTFWAGQIYRSPAKTGDINKLVEVFKNQMKKTENFEESMKMPLFTMLISPKFLYRSTEVKNEPKVSKIGDYELASKLSYFLWSSMPDQELFELADKGELSQPKVLVAQVKRMLASEKSDSLGKHLGGQWFGWEDLRADINPDTTKYPEFDFNLRVALYQESTLYFNHIVKNNGSIYDFLDSDYTFLNNRLAKFYKLPPLPSDDFQLVKLKDENRGGVLGMGSVLTATSTALRSSPSIRGAYVLKDLLGITLPEPPMNIEPLPEDEKDLKKLTVRESLVEHRENPDCRACHAEIDPIGFTLEAFDGIGRFRETQNGVNLDLTGQMPSGSTFSSPAELKDTLLKNNKKQFTESAASKLLTYALGRDLTPYDRQVVKEISEKIYEDNGSIHTAIIEVVKSYPFNYRRGDKFKPKKVK